MTKKLFTPSERYAAPEMKVVELNLNNMLMQTSLVIRNGGAGDAGDDDDYYSIDSRF